MKRALIAPLLLGLALVGCGGDDADSTATPTATGAPTATGTPAPTDTPPAAPPPPATPPPANPTASDGAAVAAEAARAALASWLGPVGDRAAIEVRSVEELTWPNGCLGLGRAGEACTEALVPGFRVELELANASYEVRTDRSGDLVRWAPRLQILVRFAAASANSIRFTTDDGGTIEAQPVFGTLFGVDVTTLSPGDPVGVAFADAPQGGGLLLVWLDPVS